LIVISENHVIDICDALSAAADISLEEDLRAAFSAGQLKILYEPIVRCSDERITGVQALLRWSSGDTSRVATSATVAAVERIGLTAEIGAWVLERACRDRSRWLLQYPESPMELWLRISAPELFAPGFADSVERIVADTSMDPAALVLEITVEGISGHRAVDVLTQLRNLGIQIAFDSCGIASVRALRQLTLFHRPLIDTVKIDRSVPAGSNLVAMSSAAQADGFIVVATGVDTEAQRGDVVKAGCESAQGLGYLPPSDAIHIATRLGVRQTQDARVVNW
jgi:EAL domain-containing protein (putative c-di-GMP-specific phosphodiesterase class I)